MSNTTEYWDRFTGEPLTDEELHARYDAALDDGYGDVNVCGYTFAASRALKELDPIAYRVGFSDWCDMELGESITEDAPESEAGA